MQQLEHLETAPFPYLVIPDKNPILDQQFLSVLLTNRPSNNKAGCPCLV